MGIPIIGDIISGVTGIIEKAIPDADKKNEIKLELQRLEDQANARYHDELMGQIDVNKVEAAHPSVFVAGWRPFIGWGSGCAFLYASVIAPAFHLVPPETGFIQTVLMGMLGLGAMRSYEKVQGVATDGISQPMVKTVTGAIGGAVKSIIPSKPKQEQKNQDVHIPPKNWQKI